MKRSRSQRYIVDFDKYILLYYGLLCLVGLVVMLDISSVQSSMTYFFRHLVFMIISVTAAIVVLYAFNLEKLRFLAPYLAYLTIILLIFVLLKGNTVKGATRSINLGLISFQPSFMARAVLVFYFAYMLDKKHDLLLTSTNPLQFMQNFPALVTITGATFGLIIMERHLSTLIIGGATLLGMLAYAGARKRLLIMVLIIGIAGGVLVLAKGADWSPIPGTVRLNHLEEDLAAVDVELSADQIQRLDNVRQPVGDHHTAAQMKMFDR